MAGAIALGVARWLENCMRVALCFHRCIRRHTFYASDRFHFLYSLARCIYLFTKVYSELPRSRDDACLGGGYFYQVL